MPRAPNHTGPPPSERRACPQRRAAGRRVLLHGAPRRDDRRDRDPADQHIASHHGRCGRLGRHRVSGDGGRAHPSQCLAHAALRLPASAAVGHHDLHPGLDRLRGEPKLRRAPGDARAPGRRRRDDGPGRADGRVRTSGQIAGHAPHVLHRLARSGRARDRAARRRRDRHLRQLAVAVSHQRAARRDWPRRRLASDPRPARRYSASPGPLGSRPQLRGPDRADLGRAPDRRLAPRLAARGRPRPRLGDCS